MMTFLDIFLPVLGLLMLLVGIRDIREARRIRRDVADLWRKEAGR